MPANLFEGQLHIVDTSLVEQRGTLYYFNVPKITTPYGYMDMISNFSAGISVKINQAYRLKFKARGNGQIWTYVFGNNYQGTYIDNGHPWNLTDQWQDYEQIIPIESMPIKHDNQGMKDGFLVDIRTMKPSQGEIADIEFTPIN